MFELSLKYVKKYMDATLILKNINFEIYAGEKIGIVGDNGSGKSTILKLIAGILPLECFPGYPQTTSHGYDEGIISIPKEARVGYLEQLPQYNNDVNVIDVLNLAFEDVFRIEKEMRLLEDKMNYLQDEELQLVLWQYSNLIQEFEAKGGYEIQEKLSKICTGLHFTESFLNKPFNLLSGGEKTSVILGKLLIDHPDILLLDEPTNHLDMESIEWLENFIKSYKGIVIIVSHDRYFLDNTVTKIIEIEDKECQTFKGNYSRYIEQKEEQMRIQFEDFRQQQKKIKSMEKTIHDLREWAKQADNNKFFRRAVSIQRKLDKMNRITKPQFDRPAMNLNLNGLERSGNETIKSKGLCKSFDGQLLFRDADLLVQYGERVALIGPNGSGKTTLIKMLYGQESPDSGLVEFGANIIPAYLPQIVTFSNEELTVIECFRQDVSILEGKAREYLSKYLFYGKTVYKKVKHLSGGERIRLKLAKLLYEDVNVLILDEPTNHLDIDSIETFEEALEAFKGTILFISHDRYFINKIAKRIIAIEDFSLKTYNGNYDFYKNEKARLIQPELTETNINQTSTNPKRNNRIQVDVEYTIHQLEHEIKDIDTQIESSALDYLELSNLYLKKENLNKQLDSALESWLELNN